MNCTIIEIPNMNDSFSVVALRDKLYQLRTTWNETAQRWSYGLYTINREPIAIGIRMIPNFFMDMQIVDDAFPRGYFFVQSSFDEIKRYDFMAGLATFVFVYWSKEDGTI